MILQNFANVRRWIIWHIYHRIYARGGFWTPLHVNEASFIVFYRNISSTSLIHSGGFDFLSNQEMNINEHFHVKIQRISSRRAFCLSRLNCQMNSTDSRFWPSVCLNFQKLFCHSFQGKVLKQIYYKLQYIGKWIYFILEHDQF